MLTRSRPLPLLVLAGLLAILAIATAGCGSSPAGAGASAGAGATGGGAVSSRAAGAGGAGVAAGVTFPPAASGLPVVSVAQLPVEAVEVLVLIDEGGPFPYEQDGATFRNREGRLPEEPAGFYREYTVPKPGEDDRGPWRIVAGADGARYWTADHYASFEEVQP